MKKYNKFDWKQDRVFVVTEKHIYNVKGRSKYWLYLIIVILELRKKVPICTLAGMTVSKDPSSNELVIHIIGDCDFRLKASK